MVFEQKILLIGATGFLGSKIFENLKEKYRVLGTYNKNIPKKEKKLYFKYNGNLSTLENKIKKYQPSIIIHSAGSSDIEKCERNKNFAKKLNYELVKKSSFLAKKYKIKLIYISSDHLFDGKKSNYLETDITNPQNYYAKTKLMSEKYITKKLKNFLILRTNFFDGLNNKFKKNFLFFIYKSLSNNRKINLFNDIHNTPISIDQFNKILIKLIKKDKKGLVNVCGNERITKYKFGLIAAKIFSLDTKLITPIKYKKILKVKRPNDMSLSNKKLNRMGIFVPSLKTQLKLLYNYKK